MGICRHKLILVPVLFLLAFSLFGEEQPDNLLDMGIQTASLMEAYDRRNAQYSDASFDGLFFDSGIDAIGFKEYPVSTEYGPTLGNLFVSYSYLRFENRLKKDSVFRFHGIDYSGRSISLAARMDIQRYGVFSEFIGDIYQQDMLIGLFSLWGLRFDLGLIRSRLTSDSEDPGIYGSFWENVGNHYRFKAGDDYSFYSSANITEYLLAQTNIGSTINYLKTTLALSNLLNSTNLVRLPPLLDNLVWYNYAAGNHLAGFDLAYGNRNKARAQQRALRSSMLSEETEEIQEDMMKDMIINYQVTANTAISLDDKKLKSIDLMGETTLMGLIIFKLGLSYLWDPIFEDPSYGANNGDVFGAKFTFGVGLFYMITLEHSVAYNHSSHLNFMAAGAYDRPVVALTVRASL